MITFLLDVNVLIALLDPEHVHHEHVHRWFGRVGRHSFATCPLTENGLVRIVGHPKYPNSPGPPSTAVELLMGIRKLRGHKFWPDSISLAQPELFEHGLLSSHSRVTDAYLLALALANGGRLATMDTKLASEAVVHGESALEVL